MKRTSAGLRWYALVGGIAIVLVTLAVLQYQSIQQISEASAGQILSTLQGALMDFRQALERELSPLCRQFSFDNGVSRDSTLGEISNRLSVWQRASAHPELVAEVYVWRDLDSTPQLLRFDPASRQFRPAKWPEEFLPLRGRLTTLSSGFPASARLGLPGAAEQNRSNPTLENHEAVFAWMIDQRIPALVHGIPEIRKSGAPPRLSWIFIRLNHEALWRHMFPEIAQRTFAHSEPAEDEFAFSDGNPEHTLVLSANGQFGKPGSLEPDAVLNLFGRPQTVLKQGHGTVQRGAFGAPVNFTPDRPLHIEPIQYTNGSATWEILGKSQKGSVDAAVKSLYYRSLATNFGVLLLLTIAIVSLIVSTQRARQLSQMQMEFVTNVSHELRTPLTGIFAAAQNIADGVVENRERTMKYGKAIMQQSEHLSELVEQILLFSATRKDRHRYHLEPAEVPELIKEALSRAEAVVKKAGTNVELRVDPDLPRVNVDPKAMAHCLQNLITNAVKYGGQERWVGIRACVQGQDGDREIQIEVRDHGMGIPEDQRKLIFEPFYRTPEATLAQIHGSGLGLPLAKSITEAMDGRLTVESAPNEGSTFTVHLPILRQ